MASKTLPLVLLLVFLVATPEAQNVSNATARSTWSTFNAASFAQGDEFVEPDVDTLIHQIQPSGKGELGPAMILPLTTIVFVLAIIMNSVTDIATATTCEDITLPPGGNWRFVDKKSRIDDPLVLKDYSPALLEWCPSKDNCLHEGFKLSSWNPTTMNNSGAIVLMVHSVEAHGRWTEDESPVGADDLIVGINCHPLIEGKNLDAVHDLDGTVESLRRVNILDYFGQGAIVGVNVLHESSPVGKWCPHGLDYLTYSPNGDCGEWAWGKTADTNFGGKLGKVGGRGIKERDWFDAARNQDRANNPQLFDAVNVDTLPTTPPRGRGDWLVRKHGLHKGKDSYLINQITSIALVTIVGVVVYFSCYDIMFKLAGNCNGKAFGVSSPDGGFGCFIRFLGWSHDSDTLNPDFDGVYLIKVMFDVWIVFPIVMFLFAMQFVLTHSSGGTKFLTGSRWVYVSTLLTVFFIIIALLLPARQWSMLQDWDSRFNRAVLSMKTVVIWLNHILMLFFLYDATVKFSRGYGLKVEPLVDDSSAALILGVAGAAASTLDFLDHGRTLFGNHEGVCYFGGLGHNTSLPWSTATANHTTETWETKVYERGLARLLAEAQHRVPAVPRGMAGQYEYRLSCPGLTITYEELMTVPDHGFESATDGDTCLLSCRWSTAPVDVQTTPIACGEDGFDGTRWTLHASMETVGKQLCPPPGEKSEVTNLRAELAKLSAEVKELKDAAKSGNHL